MRRLWLLLRHLFLRDAAWNDYPTDVFRMRALCKVPLDAYLRRYGEPRNTGFGHLRLRLNEGLGFVPFLLLSYRWGLYADGDYGFILEWHPWSGRSVALAMVTFDLREQFGGWYVIIRQLQGVKGRDSYLEGVRWERLLIHVVTDWASANGYDHVACIQGQDSVWFSKSREMAFRMRYDVTARRSGFRFMPSLRLWLRHLPVPPID